MQTHQLQAHPTDMGWEWGCSQEEGLNKDGLWGWEIPEMALTTASKDRALEKYQHWLDVRVAGEGERERVFKQEENHERESLW